MNNSKHKPVKSGFLLLDKPGGITSFDALLPIKKALASGKVGHTGTLDKFACGLLIILTGRALKLANFFMHCGKRYEGVIRFGIETETLDPEGAVVCQCALPTEADVRAALPQFTGEIMQAPPAFSAVHIDGKRASDLARSGAAPQMRARPVTIHSLELLAWEPPFAKIAVSCSSGTYIRSLARDIARAAGSCGSLSYLRRTAIAEFSPEGAFTITPNKHELPDTAAVEASIKTVDKTVFKKIGLDCLDVSCDAGAAMLNGRPISQIPNLPFSARSLPDADYAVFCNEALIAVVKQQHGKMHYLFVNAAP